MALLDPSTCVVFKQAVAGYPDLLGASGRIEALMTGSAGTKYHVRVDHRSEVVVVEARAVRKATKEEKQAANALVAKIAGKRRREGTPAGPTAAAVTTPVTAPAPPAPPPPAAAPPPPAKAEAPAFPPEHPTVYRTWEVGNWVGTKDAKSRYWLSTTDLRKLDVRSLGGGVGLGRPEYFYNPVHLERLAILTHGEAAYQAKRAKRAKRQAGEAASLQAAQARLAVAAAASTPLARPSVASASSSFSALTEDPELAGAARRYGGVAHIPLGTVIGGIPWGM